MWAWSSVVCLLPGRTGLGRCWCVYVGLLFAAVAFGVFLAGVTLLHGRPKSGGRTGMGIRGVLLAAAGLSARSVPGRRRTRRVCPPWCWASPTRTTAGTRPRAGFPRPGCRAVDCFRGPPDSRAAHPLLPPRIMLGRARGAVHVTVFLVLVLVLVVGGRPAPRAVPGRRTGGVSRCGGVVVRPGRRLRRLRSGCVRARRPSCPTGRFRARRTGSRRGPRPGRWW